MQTGSKMKSLHSFYRVGCVCSLLKHCHIRQWKNHHVIQFTPKRCMNVNPKTNFSLQSLSWQRESSRGIKTKYAASVSSGPEVLQGNIINGKAIALEIKKEIKSEVDTLLEANPKKRRPHLSVVLVGNDPASVIYVRNKRRMATAAGMTCDILRLPSAVSQTDILDEINILNNDDTVDGILVQLPLPEFISERLICDSVLPEKDVDGFNVLNVGRFCVDQEAFIPATPLGVLEILKRLKIDTCGKNAVICGRSKNVGLPIALHLQASRNGDQNAGNATTTICHRYTPSDQLKLHTLSADILVTATGIPGLVTSDMVKEGAVVIDIGITRIRDANGKHRLVGDVDFEGVKEKASLITPVPGGVGPVTVVMVLKNTLKAYKRDIDFYTTAAHKVRNCDS